MILNIQMNICIMHTLDQARTWAWNLTKYDCTVVVPWWYTTNFDQKLCSCLIAIKWRDLHTLTSKGKLSELCGESCQRQAKWQNFSKYFYYFSGLTTYLRNMWSRLREGLTHYKMLNSQRHTMGRSNFSVIEILTWKGKYWY